MTLPVRIVADTWCGLLELLYPSRCLVCREFGSDVICPACRADFTPLDPPLCSRCGLMIEPRASGLCPDCESRPLYFRQALAAGRYDGALRQAILNLKYGGRRRLAEPLGHFLAEFLRSTPLEGPAPGVVVPVPLHQSRLRERGFNQSALLAHAVGRQLGLPVWPEALRRTRKTRPQASLRVSERMKNVRDAFAVPCPDLVVGQHVLLIDDVLTSLHTVDECARVLVAGGASTVYVTGVARGL